jgi:hypothetical protein
MSPIKKSKAANYIYNGIMLLMCAFTFFGVAFLVMLTRKVEAFHILALLWVFLYMYIFCVRFFPSKKAYEKSNLYLCDTTYTFTDEELIDSSSSPKSSSTTAYKLRSFNRAYETEGFIYVYVTFNMVLIISKYGFESEEDLNAVRDILKASLPPKKYIVCK